MKILIILFIFLFSNLLANYTGKNSAKIDMHGGKNKSLLNNSILNSSREILPLGNLSIKKPSAPIKPKKLIKEKIQKEKKIK